MTQLLTAALIIVSVDGLDQRYLEQADSMGLRIPHLRKVLKEGQWSRGVVGVAPTVTWPSHTTILTGAEATEHGILGNRRPAADGGDYYWDVDLLKRPTLLAAATAAGRKVATVTWPVTVNAPVTFNLPEYFKRRRGGAMDTASICGKAKPAGLCDAIARDYPSFRQEWMDDRTRTLAVRHLLQVEKADAVFVHLVDLDSEEHDDGPFSVEAKAILEYTDELIGSMIAALPPGGRFVLVSDHGFEGVTKSVNLRFAADRDKISGVAAMGGIVTADTSAGAAWLRGLGKEYGIGREIPAAEVAQYAPKLSGKTVFECAEGIWFGFGNETLFSKPREMGNHGHWPTRYRAVYAAWGPGLKAERLPEMSMKDIAAKLAGFLGVTWPAPVR